MSKKIELFFLPFSEVCNAVTNRVYEKKTWLVHPEKGLAFAKISGMYCPQCNANPKVVEYLMKNYSAYDGLEAKTLETYFPLNSKNDFLNSKLIA